MAKQGALGGGNVSASVDHSTVGKLVVKLLLGLFIIMQVPESVLHARGVEEREKGSQTAGGQSTTLDLL